MILRLEISLGDFDEDFFKGGFFFLEEFYGETGVDQLGKEGGLFVFAASVDEFEMGVFVFGIVHVLLGGEPTGGLYLAGGEDEAELAFGASQFLANLLCRARSEDFALVHDTER